MTIVDLEQILPHRDPFLLIDEVLEVTPGVGAVARKTVRADEWYLSGHFPGRPIVPGVLLTEALAQLAGIAASGDGVDNNGVLASPTYRTRDEAGTQSPAETLVTRSGSCRDRGRLPCSRRVGDVAGKARGRRKCRAHFRGRATQPAASSGRRGRQTSAVTARGPAYR